MTSVLPFRHALLALVVATVWGSNFVVIKHVLDQFPPLLFAALRFAFALLPAVFFLKRPDVPLKQLAAYGLLIGCGQFGLLYSAMNGRIAPGLASVVMQSQVFFTILLAIWIDGERVKRRQWVAIVIAAAGIGLIAAHTDRTTTGVGLGMALAGALCWAGGNVVVMRSGRINMLAYVVWSSLFAAPPLFALSFALEGWPLIRETLQNADVYGWAGLLWQSVGNTLFGYTAWSWLLARHPAATVTPMALLIPVAGLSAAVVFLGEPMPLWKIIAAALIIGGVALNTLWPAGKVAIVEPEA